MAVLLSAAAVWLHPADVQAAKTQKISVTVNGSKQGTLVKKGRNWYLQCNHKEIYYQKSSLRLVKIGVKGKKAFSTGYYYYFKNGKIDTREQRFHKIETKIGTQSFKGIYYFGGRNGKLYQKRGWVTVKNKKYYLSSKGKRYENCWKGGYYLDEKGQILKNGKTPDGFYVDCNGRKCRKEEVKLSSLKKSIQARIPQLGGSFWSVYVKDLKTGDVLSVNNRAVYPASIIKLFVMEGIYSEIKAGRLKKTAAVKSLLHEMITVSDNEACNQLVRIIGGGSFSAGCRKLNAYLAGQGYKDTACYHMLGSAYSSDISDGGGRNHSTTKDAGLLLERIYKGTCVSKAYSREMKNLLLAQTRRWKIPAGLPSGVKCGNKTGEKFSYQHDAAIVFGSKTDYVVCIYSSSSEGTGISDIQKLSAQIYKALN